MAGPKLPDDTPASRSPIQGDALGPVVCLRNDSPSPGSHRPPSLPSASSTHAPATPWSAGLPGTPLPAHAIPPFHRQPTTLSDPWTELPGAGTTRRLSWQAAPSPASCRAWSPESRSAAIRTIANALFWLIIPGQNLGHIGALVSDRSATEGIAAPPGRFPGFRGRASPWLGGYSSALPPSIPLGYPGERPCGIDAGRWTRGQLRRPSWRQPRRNQGHCHYGGGRHGRGDSWDRSPRNCLYRGLTLQTALQNNLPPADRGDRSRPGCSRVAHLADPVPLLRIRRRDPGSPLRVRPVSRRVTGAQRAIWAPAIFAHSGFNLLTLLFCCSPTCLTGGRVTIYHRARQWTSAPGVVQRSCAHPQLERPISSPHFHHGLFHPDPGVERPRSHYPLDVPIVQSRGRPDVRAPDRLSPPRPPFPSTARIPPSECSSASSSDRCPP